MTIEKKKEKEKEKRKYRRWKKTRNFCNGFSQFSLLFPCYFYAALPYFQLRNAPSVATEISFFAHDYDAQRKGKEEIKTRILTCCSFKIEHTDTVIITIYAYSNTRWSSIWHLNCEKVEQMAQITADIFETANNRDIICFGWPKD